jgi:DNA polymerase III subunit gamma/tau
VAYVSLYRKYRPQSFAEVVGQTHVTRTLANAIAEDRLHHAYLFAGPRGTGKTSTARILAKAINCVEGPTAEPCQVCDACVGITDGSSMDVVELDMASHGGVDDARELRERALFAPSSARRKVYILDEVHMASSAAFNALLKLIEEPPPHVLFAMATTDPQKVLPTIMSRVQRLDLRRVGAVEVAAHVRRLCELEDVTIDDAAVDVVVRAGDGSVRDTLSILDQVLSFAGDEVTADQVLQLLGHTPAEVVFEAVTLLASGDLARLLELVQRLLDEGHDLRRFSLDLVVHLRDLLVLQVAPGRPDLVDATDERRGRLVAQAPSLPRDRLVGAIDVLAETVAEMRRGPARLPLELAFAKLLVGVETPSGSASQPGPASRPERSQSDAEPVSEPEPPAPQPAPEPDPAPQPEPAPPDPDPAPQPDPAPPDPEPGPEPAASRRSGVESDPLAAVVGRWQAVLDGVRQRSPRVHAIYQPATPTAVEGRRLVLAYPEKFAGFHAEEAVREDNAEVLREVLQRTLGVELTVGTRILDAGTRATTDAGTGAPPSAGAGRGADASGRADTAGRAGATGRSADHAPRSAAPADVDAGTVPEPTGAPSAPPVPPTAPPPGTRSDDEEVAVLEAESDEVQAIGLDEATRRLREHLGARPLDDGAGAGSWSAS